MVTVPFPVPLVGLTVNQLQLAETLHESVPQPIFVIEQETDPAELGKLKVEHETDRTGKVPAACVTVMVTGLPVAPDAVTVIVHDRDAHVVLA
jgi:hypothetical protein